MNKKHDPDQSAPRPVLYLLTILARGVDPHEVADQLEEEYSKQLALGGNKAARTWLWKQVFRAVPHFLFYLLYRRTTMWLNYAKITLRNVRKHKVFSFINLSGLTIGLTICLLVIEMVIGMYSQDNFHEKKDRIYRVITEEKEQNRQFTLATSPPPLAEELRQAPQVEAVVRIRSNFAGLAVYQNKIVSISGYYTDQYFFRIFSFDFLSGNSDSALAKPNTMVLKESTALKIFGNQNPVGEILTVQGVGDYRITGILKDFPLLQTHFDFECLVSTAGMSSLAQGDISSNSKNWKNVNDSYLYFLIKKNMSPDRITALFPGIITKYLHFPDKEYAFRLQALKKISPGPMLVNPLSHHTNTSDEPILMSFLALLIMLIACFNYTNLSLAMSLSRAREIGIRKAFGAGRRLVFLQFIGEALVFSLLALLVAVFLLEFIVPIFFNEVTLYFDLGHQAVKIGLAFLAFTILTGILAGFFPALYLSRFNPAQVLKDVSRIKVFSRLTLRRVLLVIQLCVSFVFIISTIVLFQQIHYQTEIDYGFNSRNIVNIELQETPYEIMKQELSQIAGIERIGACMILPNTFSRMEYGARAVQASEFIQTMVLPVDRDFIVMIGLQFTAGRNFPEESASDKESMVILNQAAVTVFGFDSPDDALGQQIVDEEKNEMEVIGVVKDFAAVHVSQPVAPVLLRSAPHYYRVAAIQVHPERRAQVLQLIETRWKKLDSFRPFKYHFYDEQMNFTLQITREIFLGVGGVAFLSGLIAFFGLLGMVIYDTESRIKEIGIRRVMGASTREVVLAVSRSFIGLLLLAVAIASPIAWILNFLVLLQNVSDRAAMGFGSFVIGIFAVCVLGLVVILSQTIRIANRNPVDTLRYE